ncbi:hypothetical protein [Cardinium endosymbiont of Nabis limbatus]|uniref:hypothetical protein n=1 Tax=Cardinium endosymbiont of Nabis limbatus TaxID=3066217 RepID=UPI003AF3D26E
MVFYNHESIATQKGFNLYYNCSSDRFAWEPLTTIANNQVVIDNQVLICTEKKPSLRCNSFSIDAPMLRCMRRFAAQNLLEGFLPLGYDTKPLSREPFHIINGWLVGVYYGKQFLVFSPFHAIQYIIDTDKENNLNFKQTVARDIHYEPRFLALLTAIYYNCEEALKLLTYNVKKKTCSVFLTVERPWESSENATNILFYLVENMAKDMEEGGHQCPYYQAILEYLLFNNKVNATTQDPFSKDNILHELAFNSAHDTLEIVLDAYKKHIDTRNANQGKDKFFHLKELFTLLHTKNIEDHTPFELAKAKLQEDSPIIPLLEEADRFVKRQHGTIHLEEKGPATCSLCSFYPLSLYNPKKRKSKWMDSYFEECQTKCIKCG